MAVYAVRLATSAALAGMLFTVLALVDSPALAVLAGIALLALAVRSLLRTAERWEDPLVRARVVATVGAG
jgi:hypothetical protein